MQIRTEAIVLHLQHHSDRISILHLYTRESGRMAYLVYGINGKRAHAQRAALQPFSLVEIEAVHHAGRTMQQLSKAHLNYVPQQSGSDIRRRTVGMFMAEILLRTLTHPLADDYLFAWLRQMVVELDTTPHPENLHLQFMTGLTDFLGITPDWEQEDPVLQQLADGESPLLSRPQRQQLLDRLCRYYAGEIDGFQTPASLAVLEELYD